MSKLATIELIRDVRQHPNADLLDIVTVLGFECITPKDKHKVGDKIVFIQPDTVLPDSTWAEPFKKYAEKRVKPKQLRKKWSEGIIASFDDVGLVYTTDITIGKDISGQIGVTKYSVPEPVDPNCIGKVLPYFMKQTFEERVENLIDEDRPLGAVGDLELKIDGQSITMGYHLKDDRHFVTNRTNELHLDKDNKYIRLWKQLGIAEKLEKLCRDYGQSLAIRGEMYGLGISSSKNNPHSKIEGLHFVLFSVYSLDERRYFRRGELLYHQNIASVLGIEAAPIVESDVILTPELIEHYQSEIKRLPNGEKFEGVVFKWNGGTMKILNKNYDADKD